MTTPLVLYGTAGASAVLSSAAKYCTNAIGGATTSVTNKCGTSTGISELCGLGTTNAWSAAGSIPAPTGKGWLYDTTLAGSTTPYGPWCGLQTLLTSVGSLSGCVMTIRYYVYNSNTLGYTSLGSSSNTSFGIGTGATTFSVPDINIAARNWATYEYLYVDAWLNIGTNSTGSSSATVKTGCVTAGQTAGWEGYALVSTPGLGTGFDTYEYDNCNRVTQSGFGTASDGSSWAVALGTAGNLTQSVTQIGVDGYTTQAVKLLCTATSTYIMTLGSNTGCPDTEINTCIMPGVTVAAFKQGVVGRWLDSTHYYACVIENALLQLMKESGTSLSTGAFVFSANTSYRMRFRLQGTTLMGKVWRSNAAEPSAWNFSTTNAAHLLHGKYGIFYLPDATTSQACYWNYTTNDLNRLLSAGGRFCLADVGTTPYPTVIMADTPSVYYRLTEGAVLEVQDYSGHGYNGTSEGTTQIDALVPGAIKGDVSTGMKYSGTPHHLVQGGFTTFAWVNFTVECWFKLTSTVFAGNMRFVNNSHSDSDKCGFQFFISANAANMKIGIGNGTLHAEAVYAPGTALTANTWYHLAATWDATTIYLYFNGVQVGTNGLVGSMGNPTASCNLGRGVPYNSDYLAGSLDEVAIYQLTLSPDQIARHYQVGIDPKWSGRAVISATDSNNTSGRAKVQASGSQNGMGRFLLSGVPHTLYGQGRFRQNVSNTQYITGRFRQNVAKTLYATGRALFRVSQTLNTTGRALLQVSASKNTTGSAKLSAGSTRNDTGRLLVNVAQTLYASGRTRLQVAQTLYMQGRTRVNVATTLYTQSRFTLSVARYLTGRLRTQVSQTKDGQGRLPLRASATLNLTGRASMRVAQTLYQAGRFSLDIAKNISGRFAVSLSRTKDTSGRMALRVQASKNVTGRAQLQVSHALSLTSRALISVTQQQAASGRLSMRATAQKFLQGRFLVVAQQSLSGMGRLLTRVTQSLSISGTARIGVSTTLNTTGRAKFLAEQIQHARGLFALAVGINMVKDLQGRFVMLAEGLQVVAGRFSTQVAQSIALSGRLRVAGEVLDDATGLFLLSLSAPKTLYMSGRTRIAALLTRAITGRFTLLAGTSQVSSGRFDLQVRQSSSTQGRAALSVGMTPSMTGRLLVNLAQSRTKDMQGRLSIRVLASLASSGRAYVSVVLSRSLSGQTRVNVGKSLASSGRFIQNALSSLSTQGRLLLVLGKTLNASGRAILSATRTRDGSGNFRANVSASQSLTGKMYVDVAARLDAIGRFVQSALRSRSSTGRLRVQEHTTQDVQGSVLLSALRSLAAQGSLSLSATRTRSATGFFFIVIYRNNTRSASGRFILYQTPEQTVRVQSARGTVSATGTRNSIRIQSTRNTIQEEQ